MNTDTQTNILRPGTFIRVASGHENHARAGLDAQVISTSDDGIGLIFGTDRYGREQGAYCAGVEAWDVEELDLATAEH